MMKDITWRSFSMVDNNFDISSMLLSPLIFQDYDYVFECFWDIHSRARLIGYREEFVC